MAAGGISDSYQRVILESTLWLRLLRKCNRRSGNPGTYRGNVCAGTVEPLQHPALHHAGRVIRQFPPQRVPLLCQRQHRRRQTQRHLRRHLGALDPRARCLPRCIGEARRLT